ncbi:MAG: YfbK domain-containing protein [Candidatus Cyclobacteriaceae bacterium M3_2C_046]
MKTKIIIVSALTVLLFSHFKLSLVEVSGHITSINDKKPIPGVNILLKGTNIYDVSDKNGYFSLKVPDKPAVLIFSHPGFERQEIVVNQKQINLQMVPVHYGKKGIMLESEQQPAIALGQRFSYVQDRSFTMQESIAEWPITYNTEEYASIHENIFLDPANNPLSTFSIDVDAASYSNIRRFIDQGQMPYKDVVKIEEMINYFNYDYNEPSGDHPFALYQEVSSCPWNNQHKLVHIGIQAQKIPSDKLPPSNLVFLIDVSGSMSAPQKLPLLKSALKMLVNQLRPQDKVALVVYAGTSGQVLPATSGQNKMEIMQAIDRLEAGGSTAGGAGLQLAYQIALDNFMKKGNNRVILASDGDFNVGVSSNSEMKRLIEQKRGTGIHLTVLGFGMGNYKDSKMETLAQYGNGKYAYIDRISEAKKVLINEFGGTLFTIARDVKIQLEFNPAIVQGYRLIGYENRLLRNEDFNNDKKDAGDIGAGHSVTALYEIIPSQAKGPDLRKVDPLKYQKNRLTDNARHSQELMTLKIRYKAPGSAESELITTTVKDSFTEISATTDTFRFSAAVAAFGMFLRDSEFLGEINLEDIYDLARNAKGQDKEGYRLEFINMISSCQLMAQK